MQKSIEMLLTTKRRGEVDNPPSTSHCTIAVLCSIFSVSSLLWDQLPYLHKERKDKEVPQNLGFPKDDKAYGPWP